MQCTLYLVYKHYSLCRLDNVCIVWKGQWGACCVYSNTVEPPNNGHFWDEHFVHCSDVVPPSEVEVQWNLR